MTRRPKLAQGAALTVAIALTLGTLASTGTLNASGTTAAAPTGTLTGDPGVPLVCDDRRPAAADTGAYGMQLDGSFRHPHATPVDEENSHTFAGSLAEYDTRSYANGVKVEAAYEGAEFTPDPFHTWQNIVDFDGRRYLFQYDRSAGRVYDITDVKAVKVIESVSRDDVQAPRGVNNETLPGKDWAINEFWGASSIQWNDERQQYVMVQSYEQRRQIPDLEAEPPHDKFNKPEGVASLPRQQAAQGIQGLRVARRAQGKLETARECEHRRHAGGDPIRKAGELIPQQGSGSVDVPYYTGQRYMFIATAPNDRYGNTEYPTYLYSPGYQAWDMSDPAKPKRLGTWHRVGQVVGESAAYRANPRCGNRTSWLGARMALFIPKPVEDGGRYGFAALGGFGVSVLDISDPQQLREVGHVDLPPSFAGTEGDNIDVSQYESTGLIYVSGYPLTEDCYEPYKDIFQIDVRNPSKPRIVGALPRPRPPASSGMTDFCQRRGSFGPKPQRLLHFARRAVSGDTDLRVLQRGGADLRCARRRPASHRRQLRSEGLWQGHAVLRIRQSDAWRLHRMGSAHHLDLHQPRHLRTVR